MLQNPKHDHKIYWGMTLLSSKVVPALDLTGLFEKQFVPICSRLFLSHKIRIIITYYLLTYDPNQLIHE